MRPFWTTLLLACALARGLVAGGPSPTEPLSVAAAIALGEAKALMDARKPAEAETRISRALTDPAAASLSAADRATLLEAQAHALGAAGREADALRPLEDALDLQTRPTDANPQAIARLATLLAHLHAVHGDADRALYVLKLIPDRNLSLRLLEARLLLRQNRAEDALNAVRATYPLSNDVTPDQLELEAAALQQLGRWAESARALERLLANHPAESLRWRQLLAAYLKADLPLRAILTLERAQARGLLTEPADSRLLAELHYLAGDFARAKRTIENAALDRAGSASETQRMAAILAACERNLSNTPSLP